MSQRMSPLSGHPLLEMELAVRISPRYASNPSLLYKNQLLKPEAALHVDFRAVAELIPSPITLPAAQGF